MVRTRNVAWLTVMTAVSLLAVALSPSPLAADLEARFAALLTPLTGAVSTAVQPAADVVLHAGQLAELTEENADLRDRVAQLEAEASALRQQQSSTEQARALRSAVGAGAGYLAASVTVRDPAPGRRGLVIDRGAEHGILLGQAVLGPGATLVGVVADVQPRASRVRLLDDPHSAVAAVLQQSKTAGALAGGPDGLRLDFVPTGSTVTSGDLVVTSPIGGQLPPGVLIGRVESVRSRAEDLFMAVRVEPYAEYQRLLEVLVVTSFRPEGR